MGPKKLPEGSQCYAYHDSLLQRPRCAALIGAIAAAWSAAESFLSNYYAELLFGPTMDNVPIPPGAWIAMETFDTLVSFQQRRTMLLVAARRRQLFSDGEMKQLEGALKKLQEAHDDRIIAAHGRWYLCDDLPDALVWMKGAGSTDAWVYNEAVFSDKLARITQRSDELHRLFTNTFTPKLRGATEDFIRILVASRQRNHTV
jgi:hypothetical protein